MNSNQYFRKAEKYKMKYHRLKLENQLGGAIVTNNYIMDLIELYDKTYNLYVLYRFRYDNTLPLIDIIKLSNLIAEHKENTQHNYDHYYIKDILNCDNIQHLLETKFNNVVFTLRQDTTKVIRNMLLLNNDSVNMIKVYIVFISKILENYDKDTENKEIIQEIYDKCIQIKGLVSLENLDFVPMKEPPKDLNGIRYKTNYIINIIGNDYENAVKDLTTKNELKDPINNQLDGLFKDCFGEIHKLLPKSI